jgi:hypothetical protein
MRSLAAAVAVAVVVLLWCGSAQAQGDRSAVEADNPLATPVDLGPYRGELLVWETGLELTVLDPAGVVLAPRRVQAHVTVVRRDGKASDKAASFQQRKAYSWAPLDLTGVRELQLKITLVVGGQRHEDTITWRLIDDRARINDGLAL